MICFLYCFENQENVELRSRVLALEFWLREEHFVQGRLIVKCVAEISGVYHDETASYIISKHKAQHKVFLNTIKLNHFCR